MAILHSSFCQKQLILLKKGTVSARFQEGSYFRCILKNHQQKEGVILKLREFSIILSRDSIPFQSLKKLDTIPFQSIKKIDLKGQRGFNVQSGVGGLFFLGGLGYLAIDQINKAFGYTDGGFDQSHRNALILAGVGAAMIFIRQRYSRVNPGVIMRTIDQTSPFYLYIHTKL